MYVSSIMAIKIVFLNLFWLRVGMLVKPHFRSFCGIFMCGHTYYNKWPTFWWNSTFPKTVSELWKQPGHHGHFIIIWGLLNFAALVVMQSPAKPEIQHFFWLDHWGHCKNLELHIFIECPWCPGFHDFKTVFGNVEFH